MPVVDTCVLNSLAKTDQLSLLEIFNNRKITPSILNELEKNKVAGFKFVERIDELLEKDKLQQIFISNEGLKEIHKLKEKYKLSLTDCECIIACKEHKDILITDDAYLIKIARKEGIKVYDLKDFLGASIIKERIKRKEELQKIISLLKEKDFYEFSEEDKTYLFSLLEKKSEE